MKTFEAESVDAIELDLIAARCSGRFADAVFHLEELLAVHMHTGNAPLRSRCAQLLAA